MKPFTYVSPASIGEAVRLVAADPAAVFLAGGTNVVDLMKLDVLSPDTLVDVSSVLDDTIERLPDGGLRIGAAALNSDIAASPLVRAEYPAVAQALLAGASAQVRNRATAAGNLLQRTRCVYFQDVSKPCNKRTPGAGCAALDGEHRGLAILGGSNACIATHPSDFAVALAAFEAVVHVTGAAGERRIPLDELYGSSEDEPHRETQLAHAELIVGIDLPAPPAGLRSQYRKVRDRASFAFALVSAAVAVDPPAGDVRIALGGVAAAPWRARQAERLLRGHVLSRTSAEAALAEELAAARPLPGNAFKVDLVRRLAAAMVEELAA